MASSKNLPASKEPGAEKPGTKETALQHQLKATLADVFFSKNIVNPKLVIGFSGGLDSCVLLHLLVECNKSLPFQLQAHHVHHGLSPNADSWASFCQNVCAKLNVPFTTSKVKVNKNSGLGLEAAAREARYKALLALDADFICLGHHQDDQAETLLLQLARGAGVKGLAGMPKQHKKLLRPLLDAPRAVLESYAKQHKLVWIEDESNIDTKYDRNFIRHEVLPVLAKQYPAIQQTISRASRHMSEANALLDEIATLDVAQCLDNPANTKQLNLQSLKKLSQPRINNALRWWLQQNEMDAPSSAQLQQITQQLLHAKTDAAVKIKVHKNITIRRYHEHAYFVDDIPNFDKNFQTEWHGEDMVNLPDHSCLLFSQKLGEGIALRHIKTKKLTIRYRKGGETIKPEEDRPTRRLNALLQTSCIPPWQRERFPLLFLEADLTLLPGVAVDARFKAEAGERGLQIDWQLK
jgi:tRNA(Ile)-lysidine synthase